MSRWQEIIKLKAEINKIETNKKEKIQRINEKNHWDITTGNEGIQRINTP